MHFERARKSADTQLVKRKNVIGAAYGGTKTNSSQNSDACYTVFVSNKVPFDALAKSDVIPKTVIRDGVARKTDVVEIGKFVDEAPILTRDPSGELGTGDWIGSNTGGYPHLITCAHAIGGQIRSDYGDGELILGSVKRKPFERIGLTVAGEMKEGYGYGEDFGRFDAGLIRITNQQIIDALDLMDECNVFVPENNDLSVLENVPVIGYGAVSGPINSTITHTRARIENSYIDFIVGDGSEYLTRAGDSGILWCSEGGLLLGMHFAGERKREDDDQSVRSASMLAYRVMKRFGISNNKIVRYTL